MPVANNRTTLIDRLRHQTPHVPATLILIAANVLVFAAMVKAGASVWHSTNGIPLAWGANFGPATQDGEWWRLLTAMFLHFGLLHLGMNMLALWDGGRLVERMYGHARFLAIYFTAGIAGNLASLAAQGSGAVSGGASGAIFGVYGALTAYIWRQRHDMHPVDFRWTFWSASGFIAVAVSFGFMVPGIDNAAHLGGLVAGVLAGTALLPQQASRRTMAAGVLALGVAALIVGLPTPKYRWSQEAQARNEIRDFLGREPALTARWQALVDAGRRGQVTFDDLAGTIDADIARRYEHSFEALSALDLSDSAPSAASVETLRRYAEQRRDAARAMAEGLRMRNPMQVRRALEQAAQAAALVEQQAAEEAKASAH